MLHDAGCHLSGNKNNCFVTMPMKGVYKLQKRNLQTNQTMMLNSQWSAQYNVWLLSPAKQAHYKFQKQGFQKRFEIWIQCRVELCWNLSSIALQKHKCYFNSLGPIADISVMRLSASWCHFGQCPWDLGSAWAENVGQREVGGCTRRVQTAWPCLGSSLEMTWFALGGPFLSFLA